VSHQSTPKLGRHDAERGDRRSASHAMKPSGVRGSSTPKNVALTTQPKHITSDTCAELISKVGGDYSAFTMQPMGRVLPTGASHRFHVCDRWW
jgi:hypothetical protein